MAGLHMDRLFESMAKKGGTDLHLAVGAPPMMRVRGKLEGLPTKVLDGEDTTAMMKAITPDLQQTQLTESGAADFAVQFPVGGKQLRFRVNIYKEHEGIAIALRRLPDTIMTIEQIGLPVIVRDLVKRPRGLFLVTGPTGSGKTTTLATLVNSIAQLGGHHILTLEDPIEIRFEHSNSLVNQREIGIHVPSFALGLRQGLRQDPDVIMVGEMRDLETMRVALSAAETGHLVLATLHTSGAAKTVDRIIDQFPEAEKEHIRVQLSTSLIGVICQQLLSRADTAGRVAAYEFLVATSGIRNLIREKKTFQLTSEIQTGRQHGMQLLDDHLFRLVGENKVTAEDAVAKANDPLALQKRIDKQA